MTQYQLSLVSAPARRDSDSSKSDMAIVDELSGMTDEEIDDAEHSDTPSHVDLSGSRYQSSTIVAQDRYFAKAMHSLHS